MCRMAESTVNILCGVSVGGMRLAPAYQPYQVHRVHKCVHYPSQTSCTITYYVPPHKCTYHTYMYDTFGVLMTRPQYKASDSDLCILKRITSL